MDGQRDLFYITEIKWERIFLEFKIDSNYENEISFYLARFDGKELMDSDYSETCKILEKVPLQYDSSDGNVYCFSLNLAAANKRSFLNNGKWAVYAYAEGRSFPVYIKEEAAYNLEKMDRVFSYNAEKYAYNVSFDLTSSDLINIRCFINSYFMKVNDKWKKRKYIQEGFSLKEKINKFMYCIIIHCIRAYYTFFRTFVRNKGNKVIFMTETKEFLSGNLRYIYDRMLERRLDKDFNLTVSCRTVVGNHQSILSWIKTVNLIVKQDYIFVDDYAPIFGFIRLGKGVKLIQVWHAGEGFKSVGYSRFGKNGTPFPNTSCHKQYDYALTGSDRLIKVYEEVFGIEKAAFLPVGMPRLDDFLDINRINEFKEKFYTDYDWLKDKKIILFAPTYRGKGQKYAYYDYDKLDLGAIYDFCKDEYAFLIKMHPFIEEKIPVPDEYKDRIFDFTDYQNINALYYVTDILITDYSSNFYEYALMERPVIFYTYDRVVYELTRGVHRSVKDTAPGKVCDTFEELMESLNNKDYEIEKLIRFKNENFSEYDGCASDRVIDTILLNKEI